MEIDKEKLRVLIEAIFDATHAFESELLLYQMIVQTLCRDRGLGPDMMKELVDRAREKASPGIAATLQPSRQVLLEKLPKIIELLGSNQDEFLELLKEWKPQGPIN